MQPTVDLLTDLNVIYAMFIADVQFAVFFYHSANTDITRRQLPPSLTVI